MAAQAAPISASLYVGDLDKDVTEAQLYDLFNQVGPVASIRVCRDAMTRRSLGYAYVNYNSTLDESAAGRAIEALNYTVVNGRPIRIMWSLRDPSVRKSNIGNIFIKNLEETIDNKALHDTFISFGNILSCKVANTPDGKSKGYGFVHFETQEAADLAIEKVNGMLLNEKKVFVGKFIRRSERSSDGSEPKFTNVYVKNLDLEVTEEQLREKFGECGEVSNCVVMQDENGKSKGFGFINFTDADAAKMAVDNLNGVLMGAKQVFVGRAQKKAEREQYLRQQFEERRIERLQKYQGVNLYVKNLDDTVDDEQLRVEFSAYGTITSAKIMVDEKGTRKGFGFVCFNSPEEATRAVTEANGRMLNNKPMYVALAQRKEVRRVQLEQHYQQRMGMGMGMALGRGPMPGPLPPGPPMYPPGAPVFFAGPGGGVVPPVPGPQRQGMVYQPMMQRAWRAPAVPQRPGFQQPLQNFMPVPMGQRQGPQQRRQRPQGQGGQQQQQQQQAPLQPPAAKNDVRGAQVPPRNANPQMRGPLKYVANGRPAGPPLAVPVPPGMLPNGVPMPEGPAAGPVPVGLVVPSGPVPGPVVGAPPAVLMAPALEALTPSILAAASPAQQKQMLGERLFPQVQGLQPELAGKITGMLLEMDNSELLLLLDSPEALVAKVDEAVSVLRQHSSVPSDDGVGASTGVAGA